MSLKAFHLFFILASTLLAAGLGGWSLRQYGDLNERWLLVLGIGSFLVTGALLAYLPWFLKKYRQYSYLSVAGLLALGLTYSPQAKACAVCFGDPNSPMVQSAATGIWFLIGCITTVLVTFIGLFAFWWSRARKLARNQEVKLAA